MNEHSKTVEKVNIKSSSIPPRPASARDRVQQFLAKRALPASQRRPPPSAWIADGSACS